MADFPQCKDCTFFVYDEDSDGECHRFPPHPVWRAPTPAEISQHHGRIENPVVTYDWTTVSQLEFCGEWKEQEHG
jgi:hypothetical protein